MRPGDFSPGNQGLPEQVTAGAGDASMRPGDFSPGNLRHQRRHMTDREKRFNEAGGFLPRKRLGTGRRRSRERGFNEAGGFLPRKLTPASDCTLTLIASMRPGDFSPGNHELIVHEIYSLDAASMRPGDFSPGNAEQWADAWTLLGAALQ